MHYTEIKAFMAVTILLKLNCENLNRAHTLVKTEYAVILIMISVLP